MTRDATGADAAAHESRRHGLDSVRGGLSDVITPRFEGRLSYPRLIGRFLGKLRPEFPEQTDSLRFWVLPGFRCIRESCLRTGEITPVESNSASIQPFPDGVALGFQLRSRQRRVKGSCHSEKFSGLVLSTECH